MRQTYLKDGLCERGLGYEQRSSAYSGRYSQVFDPDPVFWRRQIYSLAIGSKVWSFLDVGTYMPKCDNGIMIVLSNGGLWQGCGDVF